MSLNAKHKSSSQQSSSAPIKVPSMRTRSSQLMRTRTTLVQLRCSGTQSICREGMKSNYLAHLVGLSFRNWRQSHPNTPQHFLVRTRLKSNLHLCAKSHPESSSFEVISRLEIGNLFLCRQVSRNLNQL